MSQDTKQSSGCNPRLDPVLVLIKMVDSKVENMDAKVDKLHERMDKLDVAWAKAIGWAAGVAAVVSLGWQMWRN